MPYKVPQNRTKDIQRLTQVLKIKQQQLSRLEADHHQLSHRHYLLSAVCDVLQLLATLKESASTAADGNQQAATTAEVELLQQLRGLQQQQNPLLKYQSLGSSISSGDLSASLQHLGSLPSATSAYSSNSINPGFINLQSLEETDTLGTFEDPLRTLRTALLCEDQNPYPAVQELTLEQMQAEYQSMIHQLALNVGFLDNPVVRSKDNEQNPYTAIKRLVSSHSAQLTALLLRGRGFMIPQFFLSDVVTGQQLEQHDSALYDHAAQRLGLTAVQRQLITATLKVFRSLLGGVIERRSNVQTILALYSCGSSNRAAAGGCGVPPVPGQCNVSSSSGSSRCRTSSSSGATNGGQGSLGSRSQSPESVSKVMLSHHQQQMLEEQQQQQQDLAEMVKLLQKESLLKACCWTSIEGCLTWTQLAKLLIACYPHRASPLAFAQAVERMALQEHQDGVEGEEEAQGYSD